MKAFYFRRNRCTSCGHTYEPTLAKCPYCGQENPDKEARRFANFLPVPAWKEAVFFGVGYFGLQLTVLLTELICIAAVGAGNSAAFLESGKGLFVIYAVAYPLVFVLQGFFLFGDWRWIGKSLSSWKPYVAGVVGFVAMMGANVVYNLIIQGIFAASGAPLPATNGNQTNVISMVLENPVACVFIIGLIGPFVEELCYRVGLFGFMNRFAKWAGYLVGILFFGFIHFDFTALGNGEALLGEIIALPNYLGSAAVLCFLYDRFGFGASFTAHSLNNMLSIVEILISQGIAK